MNIGIDICDLAHGVVGIGSGIQQLLRYLEEKGTGHSYYLYQAEYKEYYPCSHFHKRIAPLGLYDYVKEQIYFSARSYVDELDVFYAPIHMPPVVVPRSTKVVIAVHDLNLEMDASLYPPRMRKYFIPRRLEAIKRADAVIVNSEYVKNHIMNVVEVDSEKIVCISLGIKEEFTRRYTAAEKERVRQTYMLPEKYILYVGSIEPWKRPSFLIDSFVRYKKKYKSDHHLVIVGRGGWQTEERARVERAVSERNDIQWLGYVAQEDLPDIYQLAELFVSASIREGFGLIFLEAMASGIPVVASNETSCPEIVGDGGLIFNSPDHNDCVEKIHMLLEDKKRYQSIRTQGTQRAKQFRWDFYGERVLKLFESLCTRESPA